MPIEQVVALVAALGGASAFWKYLTDKANRENEILLADKESRAEFNTTLRAQVDMLMAKVDRLVDEKEELLEAMSQLRAELGEAKATIKHLEDVIRLRQLER